MTKSVVAPLASLLFVLGLFGCGDPSVERVCGKCSGAVRDACENAYDACKETRGCDLDDLEERPTADPETLLATELGARVVEE